MQTRSTKFWLTTLIAEVEILLETVVALCLIRKMIHDKDEKNCNRNDYADGKGQLLWLIFNLLKTYIITNTSVLECVSLRIGSLKIGSYLIHERMTLSCFRLQSASFFFSARTYYNHLFSVQNIKSGKKPKICYMMPDDIK